MEAPFARFFRTRKMKAVLLVVAIYTGIYVLLSLGGEYRDNVGSLAKLGIIIRGIPDRQEWQPLFIIVTCFPGPDHALRANMPGYVFLPTVLLDRHFWHLTKPMYKSAIAQPNRVSEQRTVSIFGSRLSVRERRF